MLFYFQIEESDKLLKRKQRFGVAVSSSPGDTDVSLVEVQLLIPVTIISQI